MEKHICEHEEDWGMVKNHIKYTREFIEDINKNHLPHIYAKLNGRPTWAVTVLLAGLVSICGILLTCLLNVLF